MNQIFSALEAGYTPERILKYIQKIDPDLALKVNTAMQGGHSIEQILSFISKNGKKISNAFQPSQRGNIYQEARKSVHPALKNAGAFAAGALAGGAGAYALSRAAPQAAQVLQGELLPAIPKPPPGPFTPRAQLPGPGQAAIQPPPPIEPEGPLPYSNPTAQNKPIPPKTNQSTQPVSPALQIQSSTPQQTSIPVPSSPPASVPLPPALHDQVSGMLKAGNEIENVAAAIKSLQPQIVKDYEKATGQPIARAVEEFAKTDNLPQQQPDIASGMAPQEEKSPVQMVRSAKESPIAVGRQKLIEEGKKKYDEHMNAQEIPEPTAFMPKKEKGSIVALPTGEIGQITDIRQGIATVNANGKELRRKVEELEAEPEGLDEVARKMVDLIPEGEKSTAFQESIHLNVPTIAGEGIMVTKYYGGKWAWYLGVSNEDYSKIASGEFEPKGEARTGIAEYKPGVIDSRGAGNQQLIIQNPKYSKANRGKTWDYADTKYNALKSIDPLLQKMSRERKDEKGNIIEKGEKPNREGSPSSGLSEPSNKKTEEKPVKEKKEPPKTTPKPEPKPEPEKEESKEKVSLEEFKKKLKKEKKKELDKEYEKALNSHVEKIISDLKSDIKDREKKIREDKNPQTKSLRQKTLESKKERLSFFEEYYPKHGYKGVLRPEEYNEIKRKVKFLHG